MSLFERKETGHRLGALLLAIAAGSGAAACNVDRDEIMFQSGDFIFHFLVNRTLTGGFPGGSGFIPSFTIAGFDTTFTDAFARSTGTFGFFNDDNAFAFPAYSLAGLDRNGSTDSRLPALTDPDASVGAFCVLGSPPFGGVGEGFWDLFCNVTNLQPNTRYTVMMVRYSLTVNGELDAAATLMGEPITQPDELVPLGGTPGGFPTVECNFSVGTPVSPDINPFVLGFVDSDGSGTATIDCVPVSEAATPTWWRNFDEELPAGVEDSVPFGPNTGVAGVDLSIPSYNYLVLVEGQGDEVNPVPAGPHVLRWQVANDIEVSGAAVNNAQAPYPDRPGTAAELLPGPGVAGQANQLEATFTNLHALQGAVYQVWLLNEENGEVIAPAGDWVATAPDAEGDPIEVGSGVGVRSFNSESGWTHTFSTSDAQAGQPIGTFTHLLLSIEASEAETPSNARPVWWKFTDMAGAPDDPFRWSFNSGASVQFGELNSGIDARPFTLVSARGEGGFWGEDVGETDRLEVIFRNLPMPPTGYFYDAWLIDEDGSVAHAGELMAFDRGDVSLRDIDVDLSLTDEASSDLIVRSLTKTTAADLSSGTQFFEFLEYRLTLAPKASPGDMMPPTTVLGNFTPEPLRERKPVSEGDGGS